jgi:hypothetical protein
MYQQAETAPLGDDEPTLTGLPPTLKSNRDPMFREKEQRLIFSADPSLHCLYWVVYKERQPE